jgi:hypothetical protein
LDNGHFAAGWVGFAQITGGLLFVAVHGSAISDEAARKMFTLL